MFGWYDVPPSLLEEWVSSGPYERLTGLLLRWAIDQGADRIVFEPCDAYGGVRPFVRLAGANHPVDAMPGRVWTMVLIWIKQQLSPQGAADVIRVSHAGGELRFRLALTDAGHVAFDLVPPTCV
jgi:hypothetical protein